MRTDEKRFTITEFDFEGTQYVICVMPKEEFYREDDDLK